MTSQLSRSTRAAIRPPSTSRFSRPPSVPTGTVCRRGGSTPPHKPSGGHSVPRGSATIGGGASPRAFPCWGAPPSASPRGGAGGPPRPPPPPHAPPPPTQPPPPLAAP